MGEKMYHIQLDKSQGSKYAILPGDPARVEKIAKYLDNAKFLESNREYTSWQGELFGEKVTVISTGIGGPSAAICMEELIKVGVDTFIRIGTCGGMQQDVEAGDAVIASGAIRMEGLSKEYMPIEYPAVSNFELTSNIVEVAKKMSIKYHVGVVQSKDSFYGQHSPESMPVSYELKNKWDAWLKAGCLASEMECSAIFTIGQVRRVRTSAVLHCVWNQERNNDLRQSLDTENTIKLAIDAMKITIARDKNN